MDAKEFFQQAVLDAWNNPFPPPEPKKPSRSSKAVAPPLLPVAYAQHQSKKLIDHFVMNLPATAIEFLGAFRGIYKPLQELTGFREEVYVDGEEPRTPLVHCYCFSKELDNYEADISEVCLCPISSLIHC